MAGFLPSFQSSAQLEIHVGGMELAYCQNLSWVDDMTTVPVGGIGAYSFHALEPVGYIGRGSMTITHYSKAVFDRIKNVAGALPGNITNGVPNGRDGNSLLLTEWFNPIRLIVSRTFDVKVYERAFANGEIGGAPSRPSYTLKDCRMTNLSLTFTPGSLVNQVASFLCMSVIDHTAEDTLKAYQNG